MLTFISDILDIAKIEAGQMTVSLDVVNVSTLIEEIKVIIVPLMRRNNDLFMVEIAKEQQQRLFEPFTQAYEVMSKKHGDTGLDLAISQQFSQMMGGYIDVESQPDAGSTFTIYLPKMFVGV